MYDINVKTITRSKTFAFRVRRGDKIRTLKKRISKVYNAPPHKLLLSFTQQNLDDSKRFNDYQIKTNDVVYIAMGFYANGKKGPLLNRPALGDITHSVKNGRCAVKRPVLFGTRKLRPPDSKSGVYSNQQIVLLSHLFEASQIVEAFKEAGITSPSASTIYRHCKSKRELSPDDKSKLNDMIEDSKSMSAQEKDQVWPVLGGKWKLKPPDSRVSKISKKYSTDSIKLLGRMFGRDEICNAFKNSECKPSKSTIYKHLKDVQTQNLSSEEQSKLDSMMQNCESMFAQDDERVMPVCGEWTLCPPASGRAQYSNDEVRLFLCKFSARDINEALQNANYGPSKSHIYKCFKDVDCCEPLSSEDKSRLNSMMKKSSMVSVLAS